MESSVFSFVTALIWNSIFIVLLYLGRKSKFFVKAFGVSGIAALYCFSAVRLLLPVEFPFTRVISSYTIYPAFREAFAQTISPQSSGLRIWHVLLAVWIAVALILVGNTIIRYVSVMKRFRRLKPVEDPRIQAVLKRIQKEQGKALNLSIVKCSAVKGALSVGIIRRYILLPDRRLSEKELYCILSHEHMHLKNRDQLVKLSSILYCDFFWWNPLSYLLLKDLEQSLELKCDRNVLEKWSDREKCSYMETMALDMRYKKDQKRIEGAVYFSSAYEDEQLKERFRMIIASPKRRSKTAFLAAFTAVFILSYAFVIQSAYEPPIDEIETEPGTYMINEDDIYIQINQHGEYELVCPYGKAVITEESAMDQIEYGCRFVTEEAEV